MKKRILSIIIAIVMVIGLVPSFAIAANAADVASGTAGDISWKLTDDGTLTFSGTGAIPGYTLTARPDWYAFEAQIKKVVIESGITKVGNNAFNGCSVLSEVILPDTLTEIRNNVFYDCTNLSYVEYWGTTAPTLGMGVFNGCDNLLVVNVPTNYEGDAFTRGLNISKTLVASAATMTGITGDCTWTFDDTTGTLTISGNGAIGNDQSWSEYMSSITSIVIEDGITSIANYAFCDCSSLESVTLSESVTTIGNYAFTGCSSLKSVTLPASVTKIGNAAFYGCSSLDTVNYLGTSAPSVGSYAFIGSNLMVVNVPVDYEGDTFGDRDVVKTLVPDEADDEGCSHETFSDGSCTACGYECPHESYTNGECDNCDYVCSHNAMTYTDNGDGTHTKSCPDCQYSAPEIHDHTNGKCVCGKKAIPNYTAPTGITATYGQTLADVTLPDGYEWEDGSIILDNLGVFLFNVKFVPADTDNYEVVYGIEVVVTVDKATPNISLTSPIDKVMGGYSIELNPTSDATEVNTFEIIDGEGYSVNGNVITIDDGVVVGTTLTVKYRSVATENYDSVEGEITLTVGVPTVDTSALENAIDALEGRIEELEAEFGTDGEVTKLRAELDALKEAVSKLDNGYATDAELATAIGNVNTTITSLTTRVKNLEDTYATKTEVNTLRKDLNDQYGKLLELINANTLEIGSINTTLGQINSTLTTLATKADVKNEIDRLGELITALTTLVSTNETGISANADEISDLKTTVENLATADETLTNSVNGLSDALTTLTGRVDTAEQEIDALQQDLADAIKDLDAAMKKGDADLSAEIASLNTALTNAKAALEKADADNKAELIKKIEEADKALDDAIKTVQKNLDDAKTELDKAIKDGDTALDTKITNLNTALTNAVAALEQADTDNKAGLVKKIEQADASLQAAIDKVASDLAKAQKDLADAIATGDAALSSSIASVSASLSAAKTVLEKVDADNKAALEAKIEAAEATLNAAIKAVQKNLDDAKAELNKAIADGDTELDGKISALGEALATAKAALETTDSANKSELTTKIDEADAALQAAINALSNELNATNEKVAALETFIIIVCVISGVAFCGCGTLAVFYIIDKRKKSK